MQKSWYRPLVPHAIAVVVFLIVALVYCKPIFDHKTLSPSDTDGWKAMAHNSFQYKAEHGHFPLWTEGIFSGMPAYQIAMDGPGFGPQNWIYDLLTLWLPNPAALFFLACICFYLLALALRINPYVAMFTALAYAYSTYNPSILAVGHTTKMQAIAVMPAFLASLTWLYEKRYLLGTTALAVFTAIFIEVNHPQIVYYGLIAAAFMTVAYLIRWIRTKDYRHIIRVVVLGAAAGIVGIACSAIVTLTTIDYSKASLRNGTALSIPGGSVTKTGLSDAYALSYSSYKSETFTLLTPKMYGGSNVDPQIVAEDSKTMETLQDMPQQLSQYLSNFVRSYWGGIGTTAGPAYAGAVICLFGLLGFFLLDDKHKWWLLAAGIFTVFMSWGEYFAGFNDFLLRVLPEYNKFRAPSVIIVIPTLVLVVLAALTLNKLFSLSAADAAAIWAKYKKGLYLTGGVFVILFLLYISLDYTGQVDRNLQERMSSAPAQVQEYFRNFIHALREDRQTMFLDSILRSLAYIVIAAAIGILLIKRRIKPLLAIILVGILSFVDLITIDSQYLGADQYTDIDEAENPFQPTPADLQVMADRSYYRVFDLREGVQNITNSSATPYFHLDITGYHPAKLGIYQELIENQLYKYPNCQPVLDMLNTKYLLLPTNSGRDSAALNPGALGPVWLVHGLQFADGPRAVMDRLTTLDARDSAVLFDADKSVVPASDAGPASPGDSIWLVRNDNDDMAYHAKVAGPRFAVFSEVFYNRGWHAYIDDKEAPIVRTNYVLRGLALPAGDHTIRFEFHPASYYTGRTLQILAGVVIVALIILLGLQTWKKRV